MHRLQWALHEQNSCIPYPPPGSPTYSYKLHVYIFVVLPAVHPARGDLCCCAAAGRICCGQFGTCAKFIASFPAKRLPRSPVVCFHHAGTLICSSTQKRPAAFEQTAPGHKANRHSGCQCLCVARCCDCRWRRVMCCITCEPFTLI